MKIFKRNIPTPMAVLFAMESFILLGLVYAIEYLFFLNRNGIDAYGLFENAPVIGKSLFLVLVCQACMYLNELYDWSASRGRRDLAIRLLQSLGIACILMSMVYALFGFLSIREFTLLAAMPCMLIVIFLWRGFCRRLMQYRGFSERIAIVGTSPAAAQIMKWIARVQDSGFEIVAVFGENGEGSDRQWLPPLVPAIWPLSDFEEKIRSLKVDRIVVALEDRRGNTPIARLMDCRFRGIRVEDATSFYEGLSGKILIENLRPSWFIFSSGFRKTTFTLRLKRACDIVMAASVLILLSPLMLLVAILIRRDSEGPIIYKQDRVGEAWKEYTLYKFRSMTQDAEAKGAVWAEKNDPRVTRVGRVLRKYRIDEIPQLFNILKGDMSFVGPRPERGIFVKDLEREIPYYPQRLFVKPGLTGWAQVKYHYGASKNETMEKLQYDLYYIKHMSFFFDLSIIFDTIRVVVSGAGAR